MMKVPRLLLACGLLVPVPVLAASIDLEAYGKCTSYAVAEPPAPPDAEAVCLIPANQGMPSAQYALGAILLSREKYPEALQWLEKAASVKLPPAAHLLGEIYVHSTDSTLQARGRDLLRYAVCTGYPPAQSADDKSAAGNPDCSAAAPQSFDGSWSSQLNWVQAPPAGGTADQLRVTIAAGAPKVYIRSKSEWIEVKPGQFKLQQVDETLVVSAIDSGWDLDGKWVESWVIQLLRLSDDAAAMSFVRTVNNIFLPEATGLRVFTAVAEGRATRVAQ